MDWFEAWFDSPLYEKLYANRDEKEAHQLIDFLEQTLQLHHCSHILDLGCGRGRHAINLAKRGYRITGIDLSKRAIKTAQEKTQALSLDHDIRFMRRDMRDPLNEKFDGILNLFTTFGYFLKDRENERILDSVAQMLKTDGIFVLDYLNAQKVQTNFIATERGQFQDIRYSIKRYIQEGAIYKDITFRRGEKQRTYSERVKLYPLEWFKRNMEKRNLIIDQVHGDYEGNDFKVKNSPRMLIMSHLER